MCLAHHTQLLKVDIPPILFDPIIIMVYFSGIIATSGALSFAGSIYICFVQDAERVKGTTLLGIFNGNAE